MKKLWLIVAVLYLPLIISTALAEPPIPVNYRIAAPYAQLQNEEQVFVCPTDSLVVIANWRDFRLGYRRIGVGRSLDAGDTWTDSLVVLNLLNFAQQSDPAMAVDNDGGFYMLMLDYQPGDHDDSSSLTIIKSTDKGATWTGPHTIEDSIGPYFEDKEFIEIDQSQSIHEGNIYVAWARFPNPTRIMFARSTDGAMSFDDTLIVGPVQDLSPCGGPSDVDAGQFAFPLAGSDGSVYVFWSGWYCDDTCYCNNHLKVTKSTDGGQSFGDPLVIRVAWGNWSQVDGGIDVITQPTCASDISGGPFDGSLYLAVNSADTSNPAYYDYNIEFIRSVDGGATWTEPLYINDDYTGPDAMYDQFHPWLICNEDGTLITIFYDQRTDPVNHYKFDVFAAYSFDGGNSFTTNHRVSEVSIDPDQCKGLSYNTARDFAKDGGDIIAPSVMSGRAGKIAEYIGVTAYHDHVNAVWTDTRDGNQNIYGANWAIPLLRPRLLAPADEEFIPGTGRFEWATTWKQNDDRYRLEYSVDDSFTEYDELWLDTTFTYPDDTLADGTYYWRVKAFRIAEDDSSDYSETRQFTLESYVPMIPVPRTPADDDTLYNDYRPEFVWEQPDDSPNPVYYRLDIAADFDFTLPVATYDELIDTFFTVTDSLYDGRYFWRVTASNRFGYNFGPGAVSRFDLFHFVCGDLNDDSLVNIVDIIKLINYKYKEGSAPVPLKSADVNHDGVVNLLDIVFLINYKYKEGPEPDCGV